MNNIRVIHLFFIMILILMFAQSGKAQGISEYALLQRRIFADPDVWHLTKAYANSEWGVDLYAYPTSVSMVYNVDSTNGDVYSAMSFVSDYAFHRIVYSEAYSDWIRAYGSFGSGIGQFNSPSAVVAFNRPNGDWQNHHIYVADTWNNRICGFTYNWSSQVFSNTYEITGSGLVLPRDLDLNNGGEYSSASNDRIWVANGDNTIKKFDLDGNLLLTFGGFVDLRGVACGRSYFTDTPPPYERFANNNYIYVISDSRYIHKYYENPPGNIQYIGSVMIGPVCNPPCPWSEKITSIDVDNVGQIWTIVVDTLSGTSRIDKYTPDLDFLCSFNAGGIFNHLQSFSNSGGKWGCSNVIVLEEWGNESGALYYWIGTDIVGYMTGSNQEHWQHYAAYTLVDPALISVKVFNTGGSLVKTVKDTIPRFFDFSGYGYYGWDGTDNFGQIAPTGNYRINVIAYSAYLNGRTGEHENIVSKDGWVYHIDYSQPLLVPTITSVQAIDTSLFVVWNDNNNNELGYIIERKDMTSGQWRVIDTTSWDVVNYTDHYQVMGSETYDYRIKAYNYFGSSGYSNTVSKKAHPHPPTNLYVVNFYCNRPYRPYKVTSTEDDISKFKSQDKTYYNSPFPDSIPSDASCFYADYPTNQKPGTFAKMEVWSRSCQWYNHNYVKRETTFVDLQYRLLVQTKPDTTYCTRDWTYYFMTRTIDIYGDSSVFAPGSWGWPYACYVGSCHIPIHGYDRLNKPAIPVVFSLDQNYPNPFNPETQIKYSLPQDGKVKLVIFNIIGERVITLVDEFQAAGYKTVRWDGRDERGKEVASGIYFYDLIIDEFRDVRKMVLMK